MNQGSKVNALAYQNLMSNNRAIKPTVSTVSQRLASLSQDSHNEDAREKNSLIMHRDGGDDYPIITDVRKHETDRGEPQYLMTEANCHDHLRGIQTTLRRNSK